MDKERLEEEIQEEGKIELSASIDASGKYTFSATENIHPMFLVGLLQFSIDSVIRGDTQERPDVNEE